MGVVRKSYLKRKSRSNASKQTNTQTKPPLWVLLLWQQRYVLIQTWKNFINNTVIYIGKSLRCLEKYCVKLGEASNENSGHVECVNKLVQASVVPLFEGGIIPDDL